MILVTGATGNLGAEVVHQLQTSLKTTEFVVSSSNQDGVDLLKAKGLNARLANFNDPSSLIEAFKGINKLLLISTMDMNRFDQHKKVVDAAKISGVKQVVYTSLAIRDIKSSSVKDLMESHFQTESYLIESGLKYTILRNTMYAEALIQILGTKGFVESIKLPGGNGKVPYALRRELGEATANLLMSDGYENKIYNLVGSYAYSYSELSKELQDLTGIINTYNDISPEDYTTNLIEAGFPEFAIYLHSGTVLDIKNKQYEVDDKTMEELLGKPTANAKQFFKEVFQLK